MPNKLLNIGLVLDDTLDVTDGVQQYVITLGNWLSRNGHNVYYLVGQTERNDIKQVYSMAKNVKVSFNENSMRIPYYSSTKYIKSILDNLNLDVLHVQMPYSPLFAGKVINGVNINTNVVATFHIAPASKIVSYSSRALAILSKKTLKRFNNFISVSKAAQEFAKETYKIPSVVIPNAVDLTKFECSPNYKSKLQIVYLGRLVPRKGVIWLLKAIKELNLICNSEFNVIIAGKGPLFSTLNKYVIDNNLNNVKFLGYIKESKKSELLASADIAVFPSTGGESFGIVLLEAMASGSRVVLGGDNVGYRTVLKDNKNLLFNPKDTYQFANKLKIFLDSDVKRAKSFRWNQSQIKKYDINAVGNKILKIYYKHKQ